MSQYKLSYFDIPARGEPIRWLFLAAKVPFEDHRVQFSDWPEYKKKTNWEQLPILEVDGKQLAQWRSICRFLGKRFNMAGSTEWEQNKCDEIADCLEDLNIQVYKLYFEKDPIKLEEGNKHLKEVVFPKYLPKWNKMVKDNGGSFIVTKNATWTDVALAATFKSWDDKTPEILKPYPELANLKNAVLAFPEIQNFLKKQENK